MPKQQCYHVVKVTSSQEAVVVKFLSVFTVCEWRHVIKSNILFYSKIISLAMMNHQEADRLIRKLLKELNDLEMDLNMLKCNCRSIEEFQIDVETLYDHLACSTTDSQDFKIHLV